MLSECEKWMSEQEAEQFIIDQLRDKGEEDVLVWRVRCLLKWESDNRTIWQFKCDNDSTWRRLRLGYLQVAGFLDTDNYDGSVLLSEFLGCKVEYSTEVILRFDWVKIDSAAYVASPYPDSE